MQNELTEQQHWRSINHRGNFPTTRRTGLVAEAVDAAFALDDAHGEGEHSSVVAENLNPAAIVANLANQLSLLEKQREQLQRLLALATSAQQ